MPKSEPLDLIGAATDGETRGASVCVGLYVEALLLLLELYVLA